MPTGYTDKIKDGISFKQYALGCARAFGALIAMRDEPADAEVPRVVEPSDYHTKRMVEIENELILLDSMSIEELDASAIKDYDDQCKRVSEVIIDKSDLKTKYEAMLTEAKAYKSPSPDHDEYKKFMMSQIESSIQFDCDVSYYTDQKLILLNGVQWKTKQVKRLKGDLAYHDKENLKEIARAKGRTEWVQKMFKSLEGEE